MWIPKQSQVKLINFQQTFQLKTNENWTNRRTSTDTVGKANFRTDK